MANLPLKIRALVFLAIAFLALAVRSPRLGERPMHTDEAINAYIVGQLLAGEPYHYDPHDRHGPLLYAVAWPLARLGEAKSFAGLTEVSVRIGPVVVGTLAVFLFAALAAQIGFPSAAVAALLYAISPLFVYYSRDFIHETFFVTATLAAIVSGLRLLEKTSVRNGIVFGTSTGLMLACKETAAIHFVAFGIATLAWPGLLRAPRGFAGMIKPALVVLVSFCFVLGISYSWGGLHFHGLLDLVQAVPNFASRAGGQGHEKPFWYYLALLGGGWSGAVLLALALVGALSRKVASPNALRVLVVYTIAIVILYSAIPYKTPWLALNLCLPIILLAGIGVVWLSQFAQ
ncbi:MAG TPA: glycosyltransferase family 39 protein, partial [Verrucomicrobiae bacterium]|nr:glycosyltransferase family 39 protein [Verrucomicrobiae bacterium]